MKPQEYPNLTEQKFHSRLKLKYIEFKEFSFQIKIEVSIDFEEMSFLEHEKQIKVMIFRIPIETQAKQG